VEGNGKVGGQAAAGSLGGYRCRVAGVVVGVIAEVSLGR